MDVEATADAFVEQRGTMVMSTSPSSLGIRPVAEEDAEGGDTW